MFSGRDRVLAELRIEIAKLSEVIDNLRIETSRIATMGEIVKDHEVRIRRTERWMYAIPASLFTSAAAVVIAWLGRAH